MKKDDAFIWFNQMVSYVYASNPKFRKEILGMADRVNKEYFKIFKKKKGGLKKEMINYKDFGATDEEIEAYDKAEREHYEKTKKKKKKR